MTTHAPTQTQIRDAWDTLAPGFDEFVTPMTLELGEELLGRVGVGPGTRVLDVGAGSGALAIPAARHGAHVVGVDLAPAMVDRLRARAAAEGLSDLEGRVGDGLALDLTDGTFDLAVSLNGVSLFPDVARGLAEMVRVTKPGGKVLVVAFGPPQKAEFIRFLIGALQATIPGFVSPLATPPPPFQLADADVFRRRLTEAGLTGVTVEPTTWDMRFESVTQYWDAFTTSNPVGAGLVANLTAEQKDSVQRVLDGMFRDRSGGEPGAVLHTEINVATGTK